MTKPLSVRHQQSLGLSGFHLADRLQETMHYDHAVFVSFSVVSAEWQWFIRNLWAGREVCLP